MTTPGPHDRREHARLTRAAATPEDLAGLRNLTLFCLFVGQSRSGHSVVGTLLNAHRNAVVAHNLDVVDFLRAGVCREDLLLLLLERDRWLGKSGRVIGGYSYDIPGLSLGDQSAIRVIGDKRAGSTSRYLARNPELLQQLADEIRLPLCLIHHVRNPWDNISSIWSRKTMGIDRSLTESIDHYFEMVEGAVIGLAASPAGTRWIRTFHEDLISETRVVVTKLFSVLDLAVDEPFLDTCSGFVHSAPRPTRFEAPWTQRLIDEVADRASAYDFLARYRFDRD